MVAITDENLGAWLIKCDPMTWDLKQFIDEGGEWIDNWSVRDNYRSKMMRPGDRIVFWVSGTTKAFERGIWGIGRVTGRTYDAVPPGGGLHGYWLDEAAADRVTNDVDVDIPLLGIPVTAADLRAAGINDLEVQRVPGGSNPSWISKDHLALIEPLLPPWPDESDIDEDITVNPGGAGFGTSEQNAVVEEAAMDAVMDYYEASGWTVEDVSVQKLGWDLACSAADGETAKVEVKGVSGDLPIVLLTVNELRAAEAHDDWWLAVVTRALSAPQIMEYEGDQATKAAAPYVFRADMSSVMVGEAASE